MFEVTRQIINVVKNTGQNAVLFGMSHGPEGCGRDTYSLLRRVTWHSTHLQTLSRPQGTLYCRVYHGINPQCHNRVLIPGLSD